MITSEYSFRTVRQNVMTGLDRTDFLLGKIYFFGTIATFATLYYVLTALMIGYFNTDIIRWGKVWQYWDYIPRYFLMCFGYMTLGLFISFLIRRTGLSLFLYFGYATVGEMLLRWLPHFYFFPNKTIHYYPVKAFSDLLPIPFSQMAEEFIREYNFSLFLTPTESVTIAVVYISLLLFLVFQYFKRVDI
jgi:ABC-2 type transport system permease protein